MQCTAAVRYSPHFLHIASFINSQLLDRFLPRSQAQAAPCRYPLAHTAKLSTDIFQTVHNPQHLRTGHRILRERLAGPRLTSYYPAAPPSVKKINQVLEPLTGIKLMDYAEANRLEKIRQLKARGKGAPQKGQGKQAALKKKKK
ncbi:mitochondrial ribosomal subunit S27-domain-containing protein [Catenaria anguillulae PL171]|uniref:Small ribosomal subunit protein mS33 n=1 Tax=Catenaria anguillulae PL171 TaxID=765915 RepID=A0A1Y2I1G6_9FUNG|nr:mitochondrial ribosomal subunit S27-domain-containing protein [Catenaria anguillulae PL171]